MGPATVAVFVVAIAASRQDFTRSPEEGDWYNQVEEIRLSLPALKKFYEFYVAVENAKLKMQESCVQQFEPRVKSYSADIEGALNRCRQFVPQGSTQELKDCTLNLTQPTLSDIEANLNFVKACS